MTFDLRIKEGVKLSALHEKMWEACIAVAERYGRNGYYCMITSGRDGKHSPTSLHYSGRALDFRTHNVSTQQQKLKLAAEIADDLGDAFDVVLESDHLHVEFDPVRR